MGTRTKKSDRVTDCWNTVGVWGRSDEKCVKLEKYIHCRNCPVFSEIGHSVFEKSAPSGYLTQWRKAISEKAACDDSERNAVLVFRVCKEWFALPTEVLSEVAYERAIHRIPRNLNRFISGVVNINGEINICYSLAELMGITSDEDCDKEDKQKPKRLIIISLNESSYVFLVDEVMGLHRYGDSDLKPAPSTLDHESSKLLLGSFDQLNQQVAVFSIEKFQSKLEGAVL